MSDTSPAPTVARSGLKSAVKTDIRALVNGLSTSGGRYLMKNYNLY